MTYYDDMLHPLLMQSPPCSHVIRKDCGNVTKYTYCSHAPSDDPPVTCYFPKGTVIDAQIPPDGCRYYLDKNGFLKVTKPASQVKGDNIESVKRSFNRLHDLIATNATDPEKLLFVTFTYDPKRLKSPLTLKKVSSDMGNFFRVFRKDYPCEYIYTVEQQANTNWHMHVLLFFDFKPPYIPDDYLVSTWGKGFVRISRRFDDFDGIRNIAAYVIADLTFGSQTEHGHMKDERLLNYPSNAHLYRCSRGIKRPKVYKIEESAFFDEISSQANPPVYDRTVEVGDDFSSVVRVYRYLTFLSGDPASD